MSFQEILKMRFLNFENIKYVFSNYASDLVLDSIQPGANFCHPA